MPIRKGLCRRGEERPEEALTSPEAECIEGSIFKLTSFAPVESVLTLKEEIKMREKQTPWCVFLHDTAHEFLLHVHIRSGLASSLDLTSMIFLKRSAVADRVTARVSQWCIVVLGPHGSDLILMVANISLSYCITRDEAGSQSFSQHQTMSGHI